MLKVPELALDWRKSSAPKQMPGQSMMLALEPVLGLRMLMVLEQGLRHYWKLVLKTDFALGHCKSLGQGRLGKGKPALGQSLEEPGLVPPLYKMNAFGRPVQERELEQMTVLELASVRRPALGLERGPNKKPGPEH